MSQCIRDWRKLFGTNAVLLKQRDTELWNGLIYRMKKLLFYVPHSMVNNVIRTCRDDLGHVGLFKVVNNISKVYWFPNVRTNIQEYNNSSFQRMVNLHNIANEKLVWRTIHIDHLDPFQNIESGYKIFVCTDRCFQKVYYFRVKQPNQFQHREQIVKLNVSTELYTQEC